MLDSQMLRQVVSSCSLNSAMVLHMGLPVRRAAGECVETYIENVTWQDTNSQLHENRIYCFQNMYRSVLIWRPNTVVKTGCSHRAGDKGECLRSYIVCRHSRLHKGAPGLLMTRGTWQATNIEEPVMLEGLCDCIFAHR